MSPDQRFRPADHIRRRADFARIFGARRSAADALLVVYVLENGLRVSRLGLSVSKRIGNAVRRNYVRRRIREAFRKNRDVIPTGIDIICVARAPTDRSCKTLDRSLLDLIRRAMARSGSRNPAAAKRARAQREKL